MAEKIARGMRMIFAGTPHFAGTILETLIAAGFDIAAVLTRPDKARGRGLHLTPSPVKETAAAHNLPVLQPKTLKDPEVREKLAAFNADVMVVAAYGLIIPEAILTLPPLGCINVHASLLPRWRGAAPIARAIEAGDAKTGVCIMQMDAGLDIGAVLSRDEIAIEGEDTAGSLTVKLQKLGADLLTRTLPRLKELTPEPQDESLATYAAKITKAEAKLNWTEDASLLERKIRAFNPMPGAKTAVGGIELKIWGAHALPDDAAAAKPGTILGLSGSGITVAAGSGCLVITELQKSGGKKMSAQAFIAGHQGLIGSLFA